MLRWCAYCQQFQGETPPYDTLLITHGVCAACAESALSLTDRQADHMRTLQRVQVALARAGRRNDLEAAAHAIDEAVAANVRAVDLLLGVVAPMLYAVGEDWKRAVISVAEEHRFTRFCEEVFTLIQARVHAIVPARSCLPGRMDALVMNAAGNRHTLGMQVLALWLKAKGLRVEVLDPGTAVEEVVTRVRDLQPRLLLISMALAEQREGVVALTGRVSALPEAHRTKIVVGGNAVKQGLAAPIPGLDLIPDISILSDMILRWDETTPVLTTGSTDAQ